ncbi:MAG TPA: EAL domain-containing protein [Steroidobacteraceae bacterium]|jgi:diguanylate cyclase (GGDEF)-like protein
MLTVLAIVLCLASCAAALWISNLIQRVDKLTLAVDEAETRHREVIDQAEHGSNVRRKIEAQLLEKQQRLDRLAHHDQLTGLPNRLFLAMHLPLAMEEARRRKLPLAVLFLDLDRFKHINDTHGHEVGDKLLQAVAKRITDAVRDEDVVVRMGGDEFVVILSTVKGASQVNETAARITSTLNVPVDIDGKPLVTTVSIGVSLYPRDGEDVGSLLRHSDTAMYQAKDRGRNNFQVFSPIMDRKLKERVAIEARLRTALEAGQLDVHYQPLIDIETRKVMALEALVRWKHPEEGFISPTRFIPVAEETGLIVAVGDFVMRRVVADMVAWRSDGMTLVPVSINVSAGQLGRSNLLEAITDLTKANRLDPELLHVELTEGALFEQLESRQGESNENVVNDLRAMGVRIAIDDFGTGYSSLSYLKRWRVDYLKIDRSFVRDLVTDSNDHAIVGAIIAMAQHLHIKVIAEGVEGWPQLEMLRQLGCRYAQGYLFAEPAPASKAREFLNGRRLGLADTETDVLRVATG